jgi:CheY-like chemotaxis protein
MMKILVLEDDPQRQRSFKNWAYQGHDLTIVSTVGEAIKELEQSDFDVVCLDHDLGGQTYVQSMGKEETGYLVAVWLANNPDRQPRNIILHSLNPAGRENMKGVLPEAKIIPFVWNHTWERKDD